MVAFILCVEWVSTKRRVLGSLIVTLTYPVGEIFLGFAAMYWKHYRSYLIFIYIPALITIFYFWLIPESVRWLVATKQHKKALKLLKITAKNNNTRLSDTSHYILQSNCAEIRTDSGEDTTDKLSDIFKHKPLVVRLFVCSICWVSVCHIFYGLSLTSTKMQEDDNKYLSYITTMSAEFPASIIAYYLLEYSSRRICMCIPLTTAGVATIGIMLVPSAQIILKRSLYSIGMMAASCSFAVLYTYTAEMWPTSQRNTMMNICSMIGRCGSMIAPLTGLLKTEALPNLFLLVFGGGAILSGCVAFLLPETKNRKLPATIQDARAI